MNLQNFFWRFFFRTFSIEIFYRRQLSISHQLTDFGFFIRKNIVNFKNNN